MFLVSLVSMHLVEMIPTVNRYYYGWVYDYHGLKYVTIPQNQDVKEGDFPINFLLVSE